MEGIVRITDMSAGHTPYLPRPAIEASAKTFDETLGAHRIGDAWTPHSSPHPGPSNTTVQASKKTFVDSKGWGRFGDSISCGDIIATASSKTFSI